MRRAAGFHPVLETSSLIVARQRPGTRHRVREERVRWRARAGRGHWGVTDVVFIVLLFGITMLNLIDITITLFHVGNQGWVAEGNPLIRTIAESQGGFVAVVLKLALIALAMGVMWKLYRSASFSLAAARHREGAQRAVVVRRVQMAATFVLLGIYTFVFAWNVRIVFPLA